MSDKPRTILKISTSGLSQQAADGIASVGSQSATAATPRLKLTTKARFTATPVPTEPLDSPKTIKLKVPRKPKPAAASTNKKRDHDEVDENINAPAASGRKKLKISLVKKAVGTENEEPQSATILTPFVRFKVKDKGRKKNKQRVKGYAYDSEASDREAEPIQQWNFILRMAPGPDAEWLKSMIETRQLESNKRQFVLRFLQEDGRRAMLTVRNKTYAAILVDLPCIIESMKGWDKKGWYKSADVHQMLLVLGTIASEAEALVYPIPPGEVNEKTWAYAHGLTPPMHWVRKRRFRKRISTHAIQNIEEAVKRLLEKDTAAVGDVRYDVLDRDALRRQEEMEDEYDENAEGEYEEDYEQDAAGEDEVMEEEDEEDLAAQFESFLDGGEDGMDAGNEGLDTAETPASSGAIGMDLNIGTDSEMGTPGAGGSKPTSDDEDDDDDDDDDDESEKEERAGFQRAREEIHELEAAIKEQLVEMERMANPLLKTRIRNKIQALQADLEMKKRAVGDEDDD